MRGRLILHSFSRPIHRAPDFHQGTNSTNPFWSWLSSFLAKPTDEQIACQAPKPILLDVGLTKPFEWTPYILPLQIVRVGALYIVAVPGEFTTMSGRRLKQTVLDVLAKNGQLTPDTKVVIAGLANSYSHYVATWEEFQIQRYEGASTLYGPHTLDAYRQVRLCLRLCGRAVMGVYSFVLQVHN